MTAWSCCFCPIGHPRTNWMASLRARHREVWKAGHCHAIGAPRMVWPLHCTTCNPEYRSSKHHIKASIWNHRSHHHSFAMGVKVSKHMSSYTGWPMAAASLRELDKKLLNKVRLQLSLNLWFSKSMASWVNGWIHWMVACARAKSGCRHRGLGCCRTSLDRYEKACAPAQNSALRPWKPVHGGYLQPGWPAG